MKLFFFISIMSASLVAKPLSPVNRQDVVSHFGAKAVAKMVCFEGTVTKIDQADKGTVWYTLEDGEKFHNFPIYTLGQYVATCKDVEK